MNMTENLDKENVFTECPDKDDDFAWISTSKSIWFAKNLSIEKEICLFE